MIFRQKIITKIFFITVFFAGLLFNQKNVLGATDTVALYELIKEAQRLYDQGSYQEAEDLCKQALSSNAHFYPAYNLLGFMYARNEGKEEEAIRYFLKSLEIKKNQIANYTNISSLYNRLGRIEDSLPYLEEGLQHEPDNFQLNYNAGLVYLLFKQDPEHAIPFLKKALKQGVDNDRLLYLTGTAYLLTKKKVVALEFVTELRRVGNDFLAWELENAIRRAEEGKTIAMDEIIKNYSSQPPKAKKGTAVIVEDTKKQETKEEDQTSEATVNIKETDKKRVRGGGTIQLKTTYRPKTE